MFCQSQISSKMLQRVETTNKFTALIERAKSYPVMSLILAGASDLINGS